MTIELISRSTGQSKDKGYKFCDMPHGVLMISNYNTDCYYMKIGPDLLCFRKSDPTIMGVLSSETSKDRQKAGEIFTHTNDNFTLEFSGES